MRVFLASLLISCAVPLSASEQETTAQLEQGYKAAADALRHQLEDTLRRPEVLSQLLEPLHSANNTLLQASAETDKVFKLKHAPVPHREEVAVRIGSLSERLPFLRQDQADLYHRFHSAVLFQLTTLDKDGDVISSTPFEIAIPVTADPQMRWRFPSEDEALAAIADAFNRAAKGRLEIAKDFYEKIIEYKRLKGKK